MTMYDPLFENAPKPPRRSHKLAIVLLCACAFAALVLVCGLGAAFSTSDHATSATGRPAVVVPQTHAAPVVPAAEPTTVSPTPAAVAKPKPQAVHVADEDTPGLVGDDFPAGTYRVTQNVAGMDCYWKKSSDAEGSDIIDNDLPQGGRPQVTLKKGQWFTSETCGTWAKVK